MTENLIWSEEEARDCFNTSHFWTNFPTSVVADPSPEPPVKKGRGWKEKKRNLPLPLLLWPQQKRRLETQPVVVRSSRKRKRGQDDDNEDKSMIADEANSKAAKRSKPSFFSSFFSQSKRFFTSFYHYFYPAAPATFVEPVLLPVAPSTSSSGAVAAVVEQTATEIEQKPNSYNQKVFDLFQDRGYFIGPGDAYGGDYTLYKGDNPSTSHSLATVLVASSHFVPARDLLAFGRVQNQVAKSALVVFPVENEDSSIKPEYLVFNFRKVSVRL